MERRRLNAKCHLMHAECLASWTDAAISVCSSMPDVSFWWSPRGRAPPEGSGTLGLRLARPNLAYDVIFIRYQSFALFRADQHYLRCVIRALSEMMIWPPFGRLLEFASRFHCSRSEARYQMEEILRHITSSMYACLDLWTDTHDCPFIEAVHLAICIKIQFQHKLKHKYAVQM